MGNILKTHKFGFDIWGLVLFLLVMLPNFIWFAVPAPNDVLGTESVTPVADMIASMCQVMTVACLCFIINSNRGKLRFSTLIVTTVLCIVVYYTGWLLYYSGIVGAWIILMLTVPPCMAFILFAADRKNFPAALSATGFAACHLIFAIVNFIL